MTSWFTIKPMLGARGINQRNIPMRSKLLISTAALLAGIAVASAQNMPGGGGQSGGAVQDKPGQAQPGSQPSTKGQREQRGHMDQTTGQVPQEQKDQNAQGKDSPKEKAQPQRTQRDRNQTTGQGQRDQGQSPTQTQRDQSPTQQGQSPQRQQGQQGQQGQGQQGQAPQGQAQQGQSGGKVALTTEQRTKIRETVLVGGNAPRATNVNFSVTVGTTVPTSVRVVAVPQVLVEIYPEYRGHMYFVVGDEIIIVDRNHRIIAVIAV
jgi:Protein of unknown function (DUF1236)